MSSWNLTYVEGHRQQINDTLEAHGINLGNLLVTATNAVRHAYAPYSNFRVGSALATTRGVIISGCNVENVSYGLTVCAERVAIQTAIAQLGPANFEIAALAVVNSHGIRCSPCGACRQCIAEFGREAVVVYQDDSGYIASTTRLLLPDNFKM